MTAPAAGHPLGDRASLLPLNVRTAMEEAASLAVAARYPLPAHLVRDVMDPATCPPELLKYYAAGLGLEIWYDAWSDLRKREVCGNIWLLKRTKTKLKGIRNYLELTGAGLVAARRPRDKFFWSGGQSEADRLATIALMPQVQIRSGGAPAAAEPYRAFWSGEHVKQFWGPGRAWMPSRAPASFAARASYVVDGVSTPVTVQGLDDPLGASLLVELTSAKPGAKMFWGRKAWGTGAWVGSDAAQHVLAITPSDDAPTFAVPPGAEPSAVRPVRVFEEYGQGVAKPAWGRFAWGRSLYAYGASEAAEHVYDRVTLMDPSRAAPARQPYSFWGWSRWGRRPWTAEVLVDVPVSVPAYRFGWGRAWGRGFWGRSDMAPFWDAVAAVRIAKAKRDVVWVDTQLYAPVSFTPGLRFGDPGFTSFGDYRKAT